MNTEIRELTETDLDLVSGGLKGWKDCPGGAAAGGGPGLYPSYVPCAVTLGEVIGAFLEGFEKGKTGGRPA